MASSIANLCNTIIGTGMLATPGAFRYTGLLPGLMLILLCGFTAAAGLTMLVLCADTLGGRKNSFYRLAMKTLPRGARWFDVAIAVKVSLLRLCAPIVHDLTPDTRLGIVLWRINLVPHHLRAAHASGRTVLCKGARQPRAPAGLYPLSRLLDLLLHGGPR